MPADRDATTCCRAPMTVNTCTTSKSKLITLLIHAEVFGPTASSTAAFDLKTLMLHWINSCSHGNTWDPRPMGFCPHHMFALHGYSFIQSALGRNEVFDNIIHWVMFVLGSDLPGNASFSRNYYGSHPYKRPLY